MIRMRRNVTKDIWRAVVVAGAMIGGATGCGVASAKDPAPADHATVDMAGKNAPAKPAPKAIDAGVAVADATPPAPDAAPPAPDAGVKKVVKPKPKPRPRKDPGDDAPPRGRGFLLA